MQRALELAKNGHGFVSPNPMVGCVLVVNDKIIGEGWHQKYGGPHAEVNAVESVENKAKLNEATAYVTLEPCSHFGKTPPCADLLIQNNIRKVVVANIDPNPEVAGKGLEKLRAAGIEVLTGICEEEGRELNRRFFTFMESKRPYIILKWAQTADGFIARKDFDSKWISNSTSRKLVHKWRSEEDAILVGFNTALYDNPQLNVRDWSGNDPLRVVIDPQAELPKTHHLFDNRHSTICYNLKQSKRKEHTEWAIVSKENMLDDIMEDLYSRKIQSIIIEGGTATINKFISLNLWDEARVFSSQEVFREGINAPVILGKENYSSKVLSDRLTIYKNY